MLIQIILVFIVVWMCVLRYQKRNMVELSHKLPMTKYRPLPLIGHAYIFFGSDEDRMEMFQKLGREAIANDEGIVSVWQGQKLYVVSADVKIAELILKSCLEKDDALKCLQMLTGNGSVFAPVKIWRPRRKVLAPTFSPKNLAQFVEIFSRQSSIMAEQLQSAAGTGAFSIWNYITTYTMDSVCESTLGVAVNSQKQIEQPFLKRFELHTQLDSARLVQPWFHSEAVYKITPTYKKHAKCRDYICEFVDQIIKKKRQSLADEKEAMVESDQDLKQDKEGLKTFLELLIETSGGNRGYTNIELREETLVLVLAGTDTSAVGAAFTSVLLSRHPDIQAKVYQELQEVFGDSDRPIVADDLPRLKYLDAVIRETLRLYPSVPIIARKIDKEVTLPSGVTLVKGCGAVIHIWAVHRNPRYWGEDAEEFRPERFLDSTLKYPAAFMAFSHGPRACIGYQYAMMSMKTAMAALLRQYRILPATDTYDMDKPLRLKFDVMMRDVHHFTVQLEPRRKV
ncbi:cytochrome P450 4d8-like [Trichoplusia ni]|uniref:Cytochrome P450 4d8-like n=1 Tax=Trichoplusia ni TaxID=7111 RepID=A0A7E5VNA7_TRINI|nr:cytochrome P450 4d8-like [Trichoplusia ni]